MNLVKLERHKMERTRKVAGGGENLRGAGAIRPRPWATRCSGSLLMPSSSSSSHPMDKGLPTLPCLPHVLLPDLDRLPLLKSLSLPCLQQCLSPLGAGSLSVVTSCRNPSWIPLMLCRPRGFPAFSSVLLLPLDPPSPDHRHTFNMQTL